MPTASLIFITGTERRSEPMRLAHQQVCSNMTNDVASGKKLWSKISRNQVVRTPTTTLINLSCGRIDQFAVRIERVEKSSLVWRHVGFNSLQRIGIDEKRCPIALS
jgi:hypothetical protein